MTQENDEEVPQTELEKMEAEGWTLQQDSCSSGEPHQFVIGVPLEGVVRGIRDINVRRGREVVKTHLMTLMASTGIEMVWESAALTGLFDAAKVGDTVRIEYLGDVEMPGPKSAMKDYRVWVRPHDEG